MSQTDYQHQRQLKREHWQAIMSAWQSSGQKIPQYCKAHNLNQDQFRYWQHQLLPETIKRRTKPSENISFTQLKAPAMFQNPQMLSSSTNQLDIIFPSGHKISVPEHFDQTALRQLLEVTGVLAC